MNLVRFLSYPVYYDPASPRSVDYVMEHFYRIRSNTRKRQLLKFLVRPVARSLGRRGRDRLLDHPRFDRILPYLEGREFEAVIDARRFFRLIDFARREVVNIFKNDDLPIYFHNEIHAREKLSGADFLPRLIAVEESKKIFTEEYVCERPFKSARLRKLNVGDFIRRVQEMLRQVRGGAPIRTVPAEDYGGGLVEEIIARPEADEEIKRYFWGLLERAANLGTVELVFSHGDFRKDQVFFDLEGNLKVIDWECSGYFSRYYDPVEMFITERWLYANPAVTLPAFLKIDPAQLSAACSLYLLELASFPIRFRRDFRLTYSVPIVQGVEKRFRKYVFARR